MDSLGEALRALQEARATGQKGTIRTARRAALEAAQQFDAIQADTPRSRRADFHSFRRAFNTALGAAGVNVQQAMALAGHGHADAHALRRPGSTRTARDAAARAPGPISAHCRGQYSFSP